jgi:hypothetical protein
MDSARLGPYTYTLTDDERAKVRRRVRWLWRSEGGATLGWLPTLVALLVILGVSLWLAIAGAMNAHSAEVALMFGVASYFTGKWLHQWEIERAYDRAEAKWRAEASRDDPFSIAIDDTIVVVEAPAFKAQYRWENFTKVEETAGLVWLWMPRFRALVVSERAFSDPGRRAAFLALARAKIKPGPA